MENVAQAQERLPIKNPNRGFVAQQQLRPFNPNTDQQQAQQYPLHGHVSYQQPIAQRAQYPMLANEEQLSKSPLQAVASQQWDTLLMGLVVQNSM